MNINKLSFILLVFIFSCKSSIKEDNSDYYSKPRFDFSFYPSKKINYNGKLGNKQTYIIKAYLKTSVEKINLSWKKLKVDVPDQWMLYFCDNTRYFFDFPDSNRLKPIIIHDDYKKNPLKLYIEPNYTEGKGIVKLLVYENENPFVADTITYNISFENL